MNYRHGFHAGNFADVLKHVTLIALIQAIKRKDKSFCYVDTHAASGLYELTSQLARKSKEYEGGIEKVIAASNPPKLVQTYLDCVHRINNAKTNSKFAALDYYPGSPLIAASQMRPHDRLILCELEREAYQELRKNVADDNRAQVHHTDGFQALKAFLPPFERRGLVLIDPPYENTDEFNHIAQVLPYALKRFANGHYAIWYPIKAQQEVKRFHQVLSKNIDLPILIIELTIYPDLPQHLNGCGIALINPPFQVNEIMTETLPWLWKTLTINQQGAYHLQMLKSQ